MGDKHYRRLVILYGVYFLALGASGYTSVFLAGRGMNNAQIGLLMSVPPLVAMAASPVWGFAGDRARLKRTILAAAFFLTGIAAFFFDRVEGFLPLMALMCVYSIVSQGISPLAQTISMEYSAGTKWGFGPIRMSGSIAYQLMALALGFILSGSMPQLFRIMAVIYCFCGAYSFLLPPVEGHQHAQERVSPFLLLKDRRILLLLAMGFCGKTASMFGMSFLNKHVQEVFQSNQIMSVLAFVAILLEAPFLLFSRRFMRKLRVTQWTLLGFVLTGARFVGIALTRSLPVLVLLQLAAVAVMACFEFYPSLFMNAVAPKELKGSVQSLNVLVTFGLTQLTGSMLGGFLAERLGLQATFGIYGAFLFVALAAFALPATRAQGMEWPENV